MVEQVRVMMFRSKFVDGRDPSCVLYLCDGGYMMGVENLKGQKILRQFR